MKFKVDDIVEITGVQDMRDSIGMKAEVVNVCLGGCTVKFSAGDHWYYDNSRLKSSKPLKKTKENKMNETIRKVFKDDTLELAEKMDDNFGNDTLLEGFSGEVILTEHKQKYIEEIVRREEEAKKEEAK